ncbi:MAG: KpsF/GutQ family sugar-phosphate isomerase [Pirellulales bacterium]|nr:KpsF/GutQ family sugar-phosphate isomerase [Pirellulales bacterium]
MSSESASIDSAASNSEISDFEKLRNAREIIKLESRTLAQLADRLDQSFCDAVNLLCQCRGSVIVSGMGKAGLVGQKIMATLASTGTRAHCLHPAEAVHGDLGRVRRDDLVLMLSQSGETEEVVRLLPMLADARIPVVAITANSESTLGRAATVVIELGRLEEAGTLRLAPSTSTTAMLALGDALALVASQMRGFRREDFARFHPGGSLGQRLSRVEQLMRGLDCCRVAEQNNTVREVLVNVSLPGRRTGAIMLVDDDGKLSGIFTDSDLARLFEQRRDPQLDIPISSVMTVDPLSALLGTLVTDAVDTMARRKISELPVVDASGRPVGLIDITDVVGLMPKEDQLVEDGFNAAVDTPCRVFPQPKADSEEAA